MDKLDTVRRLFQAVSTVRDIALESKTYLFMVQPPTSFYLHCESAQVRISRWQHPQISVKVALQAGFGWRLQTEQDADGVYFVARRRTLVGELSRASFEITLPTNTYLILDLQRCDLTLTQVNGPLSIDPPGPAGQTRVDSRSEA